MNKSSKYLLLLKNTVCITTNHSYIGFSVFSDKFSLNVNIVKVSTVKLSINSKLS